MDSDFYCRRVQKRLIAIAVVITGGLVLYWYFFPELSLKKLTDVQNSAEHSTVAQIKKQISTPPPLHKAQSRTSSVPSSALTRSLRHSLSLRLLGFAYDAASIPLTKIYNSSLVEDICQPVRWESGNSHPLHF